MYGSSLKDMLMQMGGDQQQPSMVDQGAAQFPVAPLPEMPQAQQSSSGGGGGGGMGGLLSMIMSLL